MRVIRALLIASGTATMAYAALVLAPNAQFSKVTKVVPWLVGAALAHDLVLAPVVCAVAAFVIARVPSPYRAPLQGGLFATAVVTLFSIPFIRGYGRERGLPSALPLNYARGLFVMLAVIAALAVVVAATAGVRSRR